MVHLKIPFGSTELALPGVSSQDQLAVLLVVKPERCAIGIVQ
jgi:hypothetical protein